MERINSYIGLAARARRIATGSYAVETAIRNKEARLVLIDDGSSEKSKKKFMDLCRHHETACYATERPCEAAGKYGCKFLAILDDGLAIQIEKEIHIKKTSGGRG